MAPPRLSCSGALPRRPTASPLRKRQRTSEYFLSFCKFVLEYENYENIKQEEELQEKDTASPSDCSADSVDSVKQEDSEHQECLTWIHLSCAKIRRNKIPDEFICQRCRVAKHTLRRSQRIRAGRTTLPQRRRRSTCQCR
ncbi:hypothetical protein MRX96_044775 [Rhipicephalus microplus]